MPKLLTIDEAAELLRCHRETLLKWIRSGLLNGMRPTKGRILISEEEVERFLTTGAKQ